MFNFATLADAEKAQADKLKEWELMGWDKVKKPGADLAPQALTPEVQTIDSGPIVVKPVKRKTK